MNTIYAQLGRYNLAFNSEVKSVKKTLSKIDVHPNWENSLITFDHNIAILTLADAVEFTPYIQTVCMPFNSDIESYLEGALVRFYEFNKFSASNRLYTFLRNYLPSERQDYNNEFINSYS